MQYFSIRQKARQCGHISLTEHFNKWKSLGLNLGKMYEAKLLVEVGGGSGSIDYSLGQMTSGTVSIAAPELSWKYAPGIGFDLGRGEGGVFSLVSAHGATLRTLRRTDAQPANLSVDGLPKGAYFLRFRGEGGAIRSRALSLP
jgi:hypothetical protein